MYQRNLSVPKLASITFYGSMQQISKNPGDPSVQV